MNTLDQKIKIVLARSTQDETPKASIFVPLRGTDVSPQSIYRSLRRVASKLSEGAELNLAAELPIDWDEWKARNAQTLAIYETSQDLYLVPLEFEMQPRVVVASSFHIKPLLLQEDYAQHGLVVHFHQGGATLLRVGVHDYEILERYIPSSQQLTPEWPYRLDRGRVRQFMHFIRGDLKNELSGSTAFVGISSSEHSVFQLSQFWEQLGVPVIMLSDSFTREFPQQSLSVVRLRLKRLIDRRHLEKVNHNKVIEEAFELKEIIEATKNKIAKREINELCISLEDLQFGSLGSGKELNLHRYQLNHQDDDVLDDLAELAIASGVTVRVVPRKFMPAGHKILVS